VKTADSARGDSSITARKNAATKLRAAAGSSGVLSTTSPAAVVARRSGLGKASAGSMSAPAG
jgi:hypothetical protein